MQAEGDSLSSSRDLRRKWFVYGANSFEYVSFAEAERRTSARISALMAMRSSSSFCSAMLPLVKKTIRAFGSFW